MSQNYSKGQPRSRSDFQFLFQIGSGGFGRVWKVMEKKGGAVYAMKEMSKAKYKNHNSGSSPRKVWGALWTKSNCWINCTLPSSSTHMSLSKIGRICILSWSIFEEAIWDITCVFMNLSQKNKQVPLLLFRICCWMHRFSSGIHSFM